MGQICKTCRNIHNVQIPQTASHSRELKDGRDRYLDDSPELPSRAGGNSNSRSKNLQSSEKEKSAYAAEHLERISSSKLVGTSLGKEMKMSHSQNGDRQKSEVQSEYEESKDEEGLERTQKYFKMSLGHVGGAGAEGDKTESMTARTIESQLFEGLNKPKVDLVKIYTKGESSFIKSSMGLSFSRRAMNEEDINIFSDPFGVNQNVSVANFEDLQSRKSDQNQYENIFLISEIPP